MDMNGSPALEPNASLEVTAGDRRPFSQFNHWLRGTSQNTNVVKPLSDFGADEVNGGMKSYTYEFAVPADLSSTQSELSVGAASYFLVDRVDVTFEKNAEGAIGDGARFAFATTCGQGGREFQLNSGGTYVLEDVPINSSCSVSETSDGLTETNSVLDVQESGDRISNVVVNNAPADPEHPESEPSRNVAFSVLPASQASDQSSSGNAWSLTAVNRFAGLDVSKTIAGSPLSAVTGAVADTAVLADGATSMAVTYRVENNGAFELSELSLTDPSLAGQTVVDDDGNELGTIGADGVIDPALCSAAGATIAQDGTVECTINVRIWSAPGEYFSYRGEVTATATAEDVGTISATDSYGAIRLSDTFGWMLPDTGMQTLVWILVLGLLALAIGVWRYLTGRKDEEETTEESTDELD